ncbi:MAG: hypothetical protein ACREH4_14745, partial [Vitreimonas sp.]
LYPLLAALAVRAFGPGWVVLGLLVLLALRGLLGVKRGAPGGLTFALLFVAAAVALAALYDRELSVRLYPAFMNAAMLAAFAHTLWRGPSMIERFARLVEPDLPESGVRYTHAVTGVWCGFFLVNGAVAVWTAFYADWTLWTLYNGLIAYVAIATLFVGELLVRPFFRGRHAR